MNPVPDLHDVPETGVGKSIYGAGFWLTTGTVVTENDGSDGKFARCQLQYTVSANVHSNIIHVASFRSFNHNTVGVQQDGRMHRRTVGRGLNNTGKNNVVYAVLVQAVITAVCVACEECQDAAMLVKYS